MKSLILIICFILSLPCAAGDLLIGQYTYHFDEATRSNDKLLSAHPLIGYAGENYTVIAMKNTYNNTSFSALYTKRLMVNENIDLAASVGAASGYSEHKTKCKNGEVICVGYLSADIHPASNKYGIVITFAPGVFVGVGLKINLN